MTRRFPQHFLFGAATSAYQIEGGIENDWSRWEAEGRLKDPAARCARASDHWERWESDFDLLNRIGANAYRFSIEWARVEPKPGVFDDRAIDRYVKMIDGLRARGVEPMVTLLHFTHPAWFHEQTPWHMPGPEPADRFARFVEHLMPALAGRVKMYTVLNEPGVWLSGAYLGGVIPPGLKDRKALARAAVNMVRAHGRARAVIKKIGGEQVQVGIAHNMLRFLPARKFHPGDRLAAYLGSELYNHALIRALLTGRMRLAMIPGSGIADGHVPEAKDSLDFIGVNYYSRIFLKLKAFGGVGLDPFYEDRTGSGISDLNWEIYPAGLTECLVEMSKHGLPLYVTENGIDDRDDSRRATFLYDHLSAVLDAIDRGADVRGYMHWSLIDNFEWLEAFGPRFGLFRVDYQSYERTPTRAAELYREIIAAGALPDVRPAGVIKRGVGPQPIW
jgi:beta-glucosidase